MRGVIYFLAAAMVAVSAFWAYRINYAAQATMDEVAALRREIAAEREALVVLRADWAYLNAPERLARLLAEHGEGLALVPMAADRFLALADVPEPPAEAFWVRPDPSVFPLAPPGNDRLAMGAGR